MKKNGTAPSFVLVRFSQFAWRNASVRRSQSVPGCRVVSVRLKFKSHYFRKTHANGQVDPQMRIPFRLGHEGRQ